MPVTPPTDEDLTRIAAHYGFHLGAEDLRSFGALAGGLLVSYDEVERLYEQARPASPPQRRYQWPADGMVTQMVDGNAFGMNWPGRYDPDLMCHYARGRREHADALPETVKAAMFCGRYTIDRYYGRHYAMARNLALTVTAAYDAALAEADVLVMPTLPIVATDIPPPGVAREESIARSTEMIVNTAPFDVSGHPATSVPAGLAGGLPVGLMIVGRHFGDATCLRTARALEAAVGGFPSPPGN